MTPDLCSRNVAIFNYLDSGSIPCLAELSSYRYKTNIVIPFTGKPNQNVKGSMKSGHKSVVSCKLRVIMHSKIQIVKATKAR